MKGTFKYSILVVDDEPDLVRSVQDLLRFDYRVLGATRAGLVSARSLRKGRPYALLACVFVAALLPSDAVTMLLEALPMYALYEASILVATFAERRRARSAAAELPGASPAALP